MDIETQVHFVEEEIAACDLRKTKLTAVRDSLKGTVQSQLSSLAPLIEQRDFLIEENEILKEENTDLKGNKDDENTETTPLPDVPKSTP